jgi:HTH-type transcriptional regulator/antitoxin HipB
MHVKTSTDIGALVRDRRARLGWTQEELARRVGVSRLWVMQLEKGKPTAQLGLALRAIKELGVALEVSVIAPAGFGPHHPRLHLVAETIMSEAVCKRALCAE